MMWNSPTYYQNQPNRSKKKRQAENEIICQFENSELRQRDLDRITGNNWLNDTVIHFDFELLKAHYRSSERFCFVDPLLTIDIGKKKSAEDEVEDLDMADYDYIFFPCNDGKLTKANSGSHWNLLVYVTKDAVFYFFDSMSSGGAPYYVLSIARSIARGFSRNLRTEPQIRAVECNRQQNGFDCGVYAVTFCEYVVQFLNNYPEAKIDTEKMKKIVSGISPRVVTAKRKELADQVKKIQKTKSPAPPKEIDFSHCLADDEFKNDYSSHHKSVNGNPVTVINDSKSSEQESDETEPVSGFLKQTFHSFMTEFYKKISTHVPKLEQKIIELETRVSKKNEEITSLESDKKNLQNEVRALKEQNTVLKRDKHGLEGRCATLQDQKKKLESNLSKKENELDKTIRNADVERRRFDATERKLQNEILDQKKAVETVCLNMSNHLSVREENNTFKAKNERLLSDLETFKVECSKLKKQYETLDQQRGKLVQENNKSNKLCVDLKEKYVKNEIFCKKLSKKHKKLQLHYQSINAQYNAVVTEKDDLTKGHANLNLKNEVLRKENENLKNLVAKNAELELKNQELMKLLETQKNKRLLETEEARRDKEVKIDSVITTNSPKENSVAVPPPPPPVKIASRAQDEMKSKEIDDDLYSRQLATFGTETMKSLMDTKVLIVGCSGIGIEIAKNTILLGVKSVAIVDNKNATPFDFGVNCFLSELGDQCVGKNRAVSCLPALKALNPYVDVCAMTEFNILDYNVVIFADNVFTRSKMIEYNQICRKNNVKFMWCFSIGATVHMMNDFGSEFHVSDVYGGDLVVGEIQDIEIIEEANKCIVFTRTEHKLSHRRSLVSFHKMKGCEELSNGLQFKISVKDPKSFEIQTHQLSGKQITEFSGSGIFKEERVHRTFNFDALEKSLCDPRVGDDEGQYFVDFDDDDKNYKLHWAMVAYLEFQEKEGRNPDPNSKNDLSSYLQIFSNFCETQNIDFDERIAEQTLRYSGTEFVCLTSTIGAIAAQEVVKCTGKNVPIDYWVHWDAFTILPQEIEPIEKDFPSRYGHIASILGPEVLTNLQNVRCFVVGAGALGCEYLKMLALLGFKEIIVTDMDKIETSNLNRQFLFHSQHKGHSKSRTASTRAMEINPDVKIIAYEEAVGPSTEDQFDEKFWSSLGLIINAVDNFKARQYTSLKAQQYHIPLLEAGTTGLRADSQVIIPRQTVSFSKTPPTKEEIPQCTLKLFPYQPEHCIEWARELFFTFFTHIPQELLSYHDNKQEYIERFENSADFGEKLEHLKEWTKFARAPTFEGGVQIAITQFYKLFHHNIKALIESLPEKHTCTVRGVERPFWKGTKRFPHVITLDMSIDTHKHFIWSFVKILSQNFKLEIPPNSKERLHEIVKNSAVPEYKSQKISVSENESGEMKEDLILRIDESEKNILLDAIDKNLEILEMKESCESVQFEKDDDTNFHIDFLASCSNLRAQNYKIQESSKLQVKIIAGKIIPAVVTSTSAIVSLNTLELIKIVKKCPNKNFLNHSLNLSASDFSPWKLEKDLPVPPNENADVLYEFSIWDQIELSLGNLSTLRDFETALLFECTKLSEGKKKIYIYSIQSPYDEQKEIYRRTNQKRPSHVNNEQLWQRRIEKLRTQEERKMNSLFMEECRKIICFRDSSPKQEHTRHIFLKVIVFCDERLLQIPLVKVVFKSKTK